jgi:nucleotide-binding universal stress UspA family protein
MKRWVAGPMHMRGVAPYLRVFVVMSGHEHVASLLDCVAGWAERGARVHIAGLARAPAPGDASAQAAQRFCNRITLTAMLDASCETLAWRGIEADTEIIEADEARVQTETIARAARNWRAELTIGAPASPVLLAGLTDSPVLVLPTPFAHHCCVPPQRVFVASDGSAASAMAVREAARIAAPGAAIRVGYVACDPQEAQHPEDFDAVVLAAGHEGEGTAHAIVEAAQQWRADLLVLGTRGGHAGGRWRYGSVAADVAQRTVLPLLLVPQAVRSETPA